MYGDQNSRQPPVVRTSLWCINMLSMAKVRYSIHKITENMRHKETTLLAWDSNGGWFVGGRRVTAAEFVVYLRICEFLNGSNIYSF